MLRLNHDGSITLTRFGVEIATVDMVVASEMTAYDLVRWENEMRLIYYKRLLGKKKKEKS